MNKINGYIIVAHRPYRNQMPAEGFTIFGAKRNSHSPSGFEYVTAVVDTLDAKEWSWGHYFNDFSLAHKDYDNR